MDDRQHLAFLMHDVARLFRSRFDGMARARAIGVTRQQWRVLMNLARHGGRTQAELAEALDVERITLTRMIDRLADAGMVERRSDPADRRVWRLHLLPAAEAVVGRLAAIGCELEEEALAPLNDAEEAALLDALGRIHDALSRRRDRAAA